jgi:hypothetical protein
MLKIILLYYIMVKTTERSNSSGYFYDLPKVGRTQLSRHYYDGQHLIQGDCIPHNIYAQKGGSSLYLQNLISSLLPMTKERLMAVVTLLVMQHYNKYGLEKRKVQKGGSSYITMAERALSVLNKNTLAVIAGLLLLNYFNKNRLQKGGGKNCEFWDRLIHILDNKNKKQIGGFLEHVSPTKFTASALLVLLNSMFNNKSKKQSGGTCPLLNVLQRLLGPFNINQFLTAIGLVALTGTKKRQKGGDCGCGPPTLQTGGAFGDHNCGLGTNTLEVVGDKALYYNDNLQQFGCEIPSWGDNLKVAGQGKCI